MYRQEMDGFRESLGLAKSIGLPDVDTNITATTPQAGSHNHASIRHELLCIRASLECQVFPEEDGGGSDHQQARIRGELEEIRSNLEEGTQNLNAVEDAIFAQIYEEERKKQEAYLRVELDRQESLEAREKEIEEKWIEMEEARLALEWKKKETQKQLEEEVQEARSHLEEQARRMLLKQETEGRRSRSERKWEEAKKWRYARKDEEIGRRRDEERRVE